MNLGHEKEIVCLRNVGLAILKVLYLRGKSFKLRVTGTNANQYPIDGEDHSLTCSDEAANLGHENIQGNRAQEGTLAAKIGSSNDAEPLFLWRI